MSQNFFKTMGVINLTPNSFYSPSQVQRPELVLKKIIEWKDSCDVFDLGAESTAPQNSPITAVEEISRFETVAIPALKQYYSQFAVLPVISIDTYRAQTFVEISDQIRKLDPKVKLIWNDVSGIFDQTVFDFLQDHPTDSYILCHNRVPDREHTGFHRQYAVDNESTITSEVSNFFAKAAKLCQQKKITSQVYFDINFGFAKSLKENHRLLITMDKIMNEFMQHQWLLGISHKSFLKMSENADDFYHRELLHFHLLFDLKTKLHSQNLLVRVHDPKIVQLVNCAAEMLSK